VPEVQEGMGEMCDSECQTEKVQRKNMETQFKYFKEAGIQTPSFKELFFRECPPRRMVAVHSANAPCLMIEKYAFCCGFEPRHAIPR
jgi:hypothetical protein